MNMEIKDYRSPQAKVIVVKVQNVLCLSGQDGQTEGFTVNSDNSTNDSDWE